MPSQDPANLVDDSLPTPRVGPWAEEKYRLFRIYASLFATSMRRKWTHRVYIDLFAGPGRSAIRGTNRIVPGSPTIGLGVPDPYTKYIFCERERKLASALRKRAEREYPGRDVCVLCGDVNDLVDDVLAQMPQYSPESTVLSFCFADPFAVSNLRFETIRRLGERFVDFLILLPTGMDASRNWKQQFFYRKEMAALDLFFGTSEWREAWCDYAGGGRSFDAFAVDFYSIRMNGIGYSFGGVDRSVLIRNPDRNQRLYRLAFYSKSKLGEKFWDEARKYSTGQLELL
jgi:three-Cys-motif partner protein